MENQIPPVGRSCPSRRTRLSRFSALNVAGAWIAIFVPFFPGAEFSMARRKELQGICNDLLDSFNSRYNDLDGYWALGKFQTYLQSSAGQKLTFSLAGTATEKSPFPRTQLYYRQALCRHLAIRNMPSSWVGNAYLCVRKHSRTKLECTLRATTDLGREFTATACVYARPHDPQMELRSGVKHGPSRQKGL